MIIAEPDLQVLLYYQLTETLDLNGTLYYKHVLNTHTKYMRYIKVPLK